MKKFLFIGIDFSKSKFDVSILENIKQKSFAQETFENAETGYKSFLKWVSKQSRIKREDWLFCGEHTGLYSRNLSNFLAQKGLFIWLENPLQIKRCSGVKRLKTDRFDSVVIAQYACRHIDKATAYKKEKKEIESLQLLVAYRSRLVKSKVSIGTGADEMRSVIKRNGTARFIHEKSQSGVKFIKKQINEIEQEMHEMIMNSSLKENYLLINSIKGVGMQTAIALIIHTNNFSGFQTARQIASYCGSAPFQNESGTKDKGSHISRLANKELKVLLSQCATCAMLYNDDIADYARRKIAEGKPKRVVINNVRSKLIHVIFAIVKSKIPYRKNYLNPFAKSA
jgi:transposase